jgi:hypothetical protein
MRPRYAHRRRTRVSGQAITQELRDLYRLQRETADDRFGWYLAGAIQGLKWAKNRQRATPLDWYWLLQVGLTIE